MTAPHVETTAVETILGRIDLGDGRTGSVDTLRAVCEAAVELFDVDGSGLLLIDEGRVQRSTVATDDVGKELEVHQEALGEGPCVDALMHDHVVGTPDVGVDDRWPRLARVLAEKKVGAVLGAPVHVGGQAVGSINIYRTSPYDWDDSDRAALRSFSHFAAKVLTAALLADSQDKVVQQLQEALSSRVHIERAVGVLMGRHDLAAVDAFERLRQRARTERRKVHEIAEEILAGTSPEL